MNYVTARINIVCVMIFSVIVINETRHVWHVMQRDSVGCLLNSIQHDGVKFKN
jgi:hypothetical protein